MSKPITIDIGKFKGFSELICKDLPKPVFNMFTGMGQRYAKAIYNTELTLKVKEKSMKSGQAKIVVNGYVKQIQYVENTSNVAMTIFLTTDSYTGPSIIVSPGEIVKLDFEPDPEPEIIHHTKLNRIVRRK